GHQRVAIPPGNAVAQPRRDDVGLVRRARLVCRSVDRDDARIVHHLHQHDDVIVRHVEFVIVVVEPVQHYRPAAIAFLDQATLTERQVFRAFIGAFAGTIFDTFADRFSEALGPIDERDFPVSRLYDVGRTRFPEDAGEADA